MPFDWKPESKEKYYQKAYKIIQDVGAAELLKIDRTAFSKIGYNNPEGIFYKSTVEITLLPMPQEKMEEWKAAKAADNRIKDYPEFTDNRMYQIKRPAKLIYGRIEIELEEEDA